MLPYVLTVLPGDESLGPERLRATGDYKASGDNGSWFRALLNTFPNLSGRHQYSLPRMFYNSSQRSAEHREFMGVMLL